MGDFILYHKDRLSKDKAEAVLSCLARQGSTHPVSAAHASYIIHFFPKQLSPIPNFVKNDQGDFCGVSGTLIYKGLLGEEALTTLLNDFTIDQYQPENFSGIFTVILKKNNRLYLLTDPLGGNRIYQNDPASLWSSSFLGAATACAVLSPNTQAIYEYAFQETTYGQDTVFQQVTCLDSLKIFEFTDEDLIPHDKNLRFDFEPSLEPQALLIEKTVAMLRDAVKPISKIFGDRIRTALSGGYDSRLMLALLKDSGANPGVYVYGPDNSPDVQVARTIAQGEGFPLEHIDKNAYPVPTADEYQTVIRDNFYGLDGLPGESIFDFGANMATRRNRARQGDMIFNGGGGEIYRNFFYLPDRKYTITDLINSFYSRYSLSICQDNFSASTYRNNLRAKIKTALGASSDHLNRSQVEYAYPAFRLRYWTSRDNNNNTRLGSYLTPFLSYALIKQALTIPLHYKNHGDFQAELIKTISPELAAYQSDYGYAFDEKVPFKIKLKNYLTYYRPTGLRRYSYALQHKMAELHLPKTLSTEMIAPTFPTGISHMSRYFKINEIRDASLLGRIYTMEYLFQHFGL